MINRIEVQNDIAYFRLAEQDVSFPLSHKREKKTKFFELPSENEINLTLAKAKKAAIDDARELGMSSEGIDTYDFKSSLSILNYEETEENCDIDEFGVIEECNEDECQSETPSDRLDPSSPFTLVTDEHGIETTLRKSTLIWMLTEPGVGISKDRLKRVQVSKKRKTDD